MIKEVYIRSFGKLKDFRIDFSAGLNIVTGQNEAGKTTICDFIFMMLYGEASKSRDLLVNKREKYKPWDFGEMSGYIIFLKNGIEIRIDREFGHTKSKDKVSVYENNSARVIEIGTMDVGEFLLGLNSESFKRTLFIENDSTILSNTNDEISKKLLNLVTAGSEEISFNRIKKSLDAKIEELVSKSKSKGLLVEKQREIEDLRLEIEESRMDENSKQIIQDKIDDLDSQLKAKLEKRDLIENNQHIIEDLSDLENEERLISRDISNVVELKRVDENLRKKALEKTNRQKREIVRNINIIFLIMLLVTIGAFLLFKLSSYFLIVLIASLILGYIFTSNWAKKDIGKIDFSENSDFEIKIQELRRDLKFVEMAKQEKKYNLSELGIGLKEFEFENIKNLNEEIIKISSEISYLKSSAIERYRGKKNLSTLEKEFDDLSKDLAILRKKYQNLLKTKGYLKQAFEDFEVSFSKMLSERVSENIREITDGKYDRILVSNDFEIKIENFKDKKVKDWRYFSTGTIEQIYFALRLGIVELIQENFDDRILILDDILLKYDKIRATKVLDIFNEQRLKQVILFTCKDSRDFCDTEANIIKI